MVASKREKITAMMKDPDWIQRWPRGPQRRQAIEAELAGNTDDKPTPAPLTLESTRDDQPVKAKKKRRKRAAQAVKPAATDQPTDQPTPGGGKKP